MKKLIVVALHAEATPLIDYFRLRKDPASSTISSYLNGSTMLAVSGVGKTKSAVATTYLLAQARNLREIGIFNIGICGSSSPTVDIGTLLFINQVRDSASKRAFYPDVLVKHRLPEATLTTFDRAVSQTDPEIREGDIVDMEAAGFCEAALAFLAPHQIACLKIVSDHLRGERLERSQVTQLIERKVSQIADVIAQYEAMHFPSNDILSPADHALMQQLRLQLRLTDSQFYLLRDWIKGYKIRNKGSMPVLKEFLTHSVQTKQERNDRFDYLRSILVGA